MRPNFLSVVFYKCSITLRTDNTILFPCNCANISKLYQHVCLREHKHKSMQTSGHTYAHKQTNTSYTDKSNAYTATRVSKLLISPQKPRSTKAWRSPAIYLPGQTQNCCQPDLINAYKETLHITLHNGTYRYLYRRDTETPYITHILTHLQRRFTCIFINTHINCTNTCTHIHK